MTLRPARNEDIPLLQAIERAAAELFRPLGLLTLEGLSDVVSDAEHRANIAAGLALAIEQDGAAVGYATGYAVESAVYLHQLDVHPDHQRRGLGRRLVDAFCARAKAQGANAVILSTFRDVPWNAPFYRTCGFADVQRPNYAPWMQAIEADQARMLDIDTRVFMRRPL
ncbi:MAG: GNAT family N-acetyltransferase [Alphaproteobacteria bacterium]|nr:GNAT family N-acetyltransferase [Alphaproteobacteria bacterium]